MEGGIVVVDLWTEDSQMPKRVTLLFFKSSFQEKKINKKGGTIALYDQDGLFAHW